MEKLLTKANGFAFANGGTLPYSQTIAMDNSHLLIAADRTGQNLIYAVTCA
jgi:hypothetical protein